MKKSFFILMLLLFSATLVHAGPVVAMKTSLGEIKIELDQEKAPETVANFLSYVDKGYYDETIFHRVIKDFMIQGGGFEKSGKRKQTMKPITNEADNGLRNEKGTIAMARTSDINSATSQFFINLIDNDFLNHRGNTPRMYGYAVFGKVIEGMDVVEKIGRVKTIAKSALFKNYPQPVVVIESVRRVNQ